MSDDRPFAPPAEHGPRAHTGRRLLAIGIDTALLVLLAFAWGFQVDRFGSSLGQLATSTGSGSARMLAERFPELLAIGLTMLMIALHTPFSWRGQSLGLGLAGLQLRHRGQPASIPHVAAWAVLTWLLGVLTVFGLIEVYLTLTRPEAAWGAASLGGLALVPLLANEGLGALHGQTPLDRLLVLQVDLRSAPLPDAPETGPEPDTSGWSPRPGFRPRDRPVDHDVHGWRAESSINPWAGLVGRDEVGAMPEPPPEPEHVEHTADPGIAGTRRVDPDEEALVARLRARIGAEPAED